MARRPDWSERLSAYLASVYDRPHAYGEHDCVLHAANVEQAITGKDRAESFRGRYTTELGAARLLKRLGFASVEQLLDTHLPIIPASFAQRGDPVLADDAIGVCIGTDAVFVGEQGDRAGLIRRHRREWQKAWAIR